MIDHVKEVLVDFDPLLRVLQSSIEIKFSHSHGHLWISVPLETLWKVMNAHQNHSRILCSPENHWASMEHNSHYFDAKKHIENTLHTLLLFYKFNAEILCKKLRYEPCVLIWSTQSSGSKSTSILMMSYAVQIRKILFFYFHNFNQPRNRLTSPGTKLFSTVLSEIDSWTRFNSVNCHVADFSGQTIYQDWCPVKYEGRKCTDQFEWDIQWAKNCWPL